ncbi:MAG: hypothetical protein AAGA35_01025 [Patescibacteria group bacterium]
MKTLFYIGGPLILLTWFALYSNALTFGNQHPGMVHLPGVQPGGTFLGLFTTKVYQCDETGANCVLVEETTEVSEIEGLEFEEDPIEYREGASSDYNKTKQPGLNKYPYIQVKRPKDFDWGTGKFIFTPEDFEPYTEPDLELDLD